MRITGGKVWLVEGVKYNWTLVRLHTDEGLTGIGEATNWPGSPLVEAACRHVIDRILGEDARRIDYLWTKLYRDLNWLGQAGPLLSAISAVDIALWDLAGKRAGRPVYELLGGAYRTQIELYANYWFTHGDGSPESYRSQARAMKQMGFRACKFDPFAHTQYLYGDHLASNLGLAEPQKRMAEDRVRAVAEELGPDFPIAIETHGLLNAPTAVEMARRLAKVLFHCMWYEEPAGPEFPEAIADIRMRIPFPVCVGERLHSRFMFRPVLERRAADILMPDITRCGGISEMRKIAAMAEAYNIPIAPHNPNGPVSTIASAHVMAAIPNFFRQEFMVQDVPWRDTVLDRPLPVRDGFFHLDDRPGLGFDLVEEELDSHPGVVTSREGYYV